MEEKVWQAYLYDFYGDLLNEHQRKIYEDVIFEDLSLGEIALAQGISRQGVHDVVKRSQRTLQDYENKLHLVEKFLAVRDSVGKIRTLCRDQKAPMSDVLRQIQQLSDGILEEL